MCGLLENYFQVSLDLLWMNIGKQIWDGWNKMLMWLLACFWNVAAKKTTGCFLITRFSFFDFSSKLVGCVSSQSD